MRSSGTIIAIGGGEIRTGETLTIDEKIVQFSGKAEPHLLLLPTASHDDWKAVKYARRVFKRLGCLVDYLRLTDPATTDAMAAEKIAAADIIYIGGGSTAFLIDTWKKRGVDVLLLSALDHGTLMSGSSAGANCWFAAGYSDSIEGEEKYSWVKCLGIFPWYFCPHYNMTDRMGFDALLETTGMDGLALENATALVWRSGKAEIIKADPSRRAFAFQHENGILVKREISGNLGQIFKG